MEMQGRVKLPEQPTIPLTLSISATSVPATYTGVNKTDFCKVRKQTGENAE